MTKIVVIGLDGCSWSLLNPWIQSGDLPNFNFFMKKGTFGKFKSTYPPFTVPAWPCILTSKNPETLNIYSFTRRDKHSYGVSTVKVSYDGAIWEILKKANRRCYIINIPFTVLPKENEINGIFVIGPIMKIGKYTNDERIKNLIEDIGYQLDVPLLERGREILYLKNIINRSKKQFLLVEKLLDDKWELLFYVNFLTDQISHNFWKFLDKNHPDFIKDDRIVILIRKFYKIVDEFLGKVAKKSDILFIISDHGFGPLYYDLSLNYWLALKGFLKFKKYNLVAQVKYRLIKLINFLRTPLIKPIFNKLTNFLQKYKSENSKYRLPILKYINWGETHAYSIHYGGININLKGREPEGIVEITDYDKLRSKIINLVLKLKDPEGRSVVEAAIKVEKLYNNPSPEIFPDIVLKFKNISNYVNRMDLFSGLKDSLFFKTDKSGSHDVQGIFLAYGNGIKNAYEIINVELFDLFPTILHILSIPSPNDIVGKILQDIFKEDSVYKNLPIKEFTPKPKAEHVIDDHVKKLRRKHYI
ncbi:hypothetical protein LCGC14_1017430 [marine sediment metagenome]|uniref:Type I phosphodiesterase/nucleotide pyrophosphatase n=1 Tax=marine sediment metagenome TaxID=412755 RepID=A0A0F9QGQ6_9ZZZZ